MLKNLLDEFKAFLLRGNILQLAVAFVMGTAFSTLVTRTVDTLINPLLAKIIGSGFGHDGWLNFTYLQVGNFLSAVITFVVTAAAVFFLIVKPLNFFFGEKKKDEPVVPPATLEDVVAELKALRAAIGHVEAAPVAPAAPVQLAKPVLRATAPPAAAQPAAPPPPPPPPALP